MIQAFSRAIAQLNDPKVRGVLWLSIGAAILVFAGLWTTIATLLAKTAFFEISWLETAVDVLGGLSTLVLTLFLFPGVVATVIGLFLESVADAVETRHYPDLAPADGLDAWTSVMVAARYLAVLVAVNLLVLPFLLLGPVFPFVFYFANGYLVSREYFELVSLRRMTPEDARGLRLRHRWRLLMAGVVITVLLTIPVVNLLAPVVATAAMVHLVEGWRRAEAHPDESRI